MTRWTLLLAAITTAGTCAVAHAETKPAMRGVSAASVMPVMRTIDRARLKQRTVVTRAFPVAKAGGGVDMGGWTALTQNGATGSPALIAFRRPLLVVRGSDNNWLAAPFDAAAPELVDAIALSSFSSHPGDVDCDVGVDYWLPKYISSPGQAECVQRMPSGIVSTIWVEPTPTGTLSIWEGDERGNDGSFAAPTILDPVDLISWDGGSGLNRHAGYTGTKPMGWSKIAGFSAYAPPACDRRVCVIGDGAGMSASPAQWNATTAMLQSKGKVPAVPGGGGFGKGEMALLRVPTETGARLVLLARGKDGRAWSTQASEATMAFTPWKAEGGSIAAGSTPACALIARKPTCVVRAVDNRIYLKAIPLASGFGI